MSSESISKISKKIIEFCYYGLFFLAPLVFTSLNYELFEFNKMLLVYAFCVLILGFWLIRMTAEKRLILRRTPFDIPLLFFLGSQIISAFFSIDRHTSIWGYYSRFNGGLLSTFAYLILFYAFVSNFDSEKRKGIVKRILKISLASGALVSLYGALEHFGIDANYWVQDVKNRVFSTLGQPNWLAAYLSILLNIAIGFLFSNSVTAETDLGQEQKSNIKNRKKGLLSFGVVTLFYVVLLFTKSRSGFVGFWTGLLLFYLTLFLIIENVNNLANFITIVIKQVCKLAFQASLIKFARLRGILLVVLINFIVITFIVGAPFPQLSKFQLSNVLNLRFLPEDSRGILMFGNEGQKSAASKFQGPVLETGGTESGEIREIVWKGAVNIWKRYPLFGSGVETFAYAYYRDRPEEHNMTSEWDFLYNKAHNEYLNYLATTGVIGLISYLAFILTYIVWVVRQFLSARLNSKSEYLNSKQYPNSIDLHDHLLFLGLFAGWLTILVSNFFGFSVVMTALFFFLIPAFSLVLRGDLTEGKAAESRQMTRYQYLLILAVLFFIFNFLFLILNYWLADYHYAKGVNFGKSKMYLKSYGELLEAISLKGDEPNYHDEMANTLANIAAGLKEDDADLAQKSSLAASAESDYAIQTSPANVSYYKTRTKVFYLLSFVDSANFTQAVKALEMASKLAPTDAKIRYNLALLYGQDGKRAMAIDELKRTTVLKSDYRDAWFALAVYLKEDGNDEEAKKVLEHILAKVMPNDSETKEKLKEWEK